MFSTRAYSFMINVVFGVDLSLQKSASTDHHQDCEADQIPDEGQLNSTLNNSSDVDSETVDESSESRTDIYLNSASSSSSEADTDIEENSNDLYSEEEDEMKLDDELLGPVYDGSKVTVLGAYCAIMEFNRAYRLPFTAIAMLLQLLQLLCPSVNKLPCSVYVFMTFFQRYSSPCKRTNFCPSVVLSGIQIKSGVPMETVNIMSRTQ